MKPQCINVFVFVMNITTFIIDYGGGQLSTSMDRNANQTLRLSFSIYQNDKLFLSPEALRGASQFPGSKGRVVAASIGGVKVENLTEPVQSIFNPTEVSQNQCNWWPSGLRYCN